MDEIFLSKIIKSKFYEKICNVNHYYTYISELLTGIVYFLLILFKPNTQTGVIVYLVTVMFGSFILFIKSPKDILFYLVFSLIMYLTNFNFIHFNTALTILLYMTLLMGCIVAFLVSFRFNINYRTSVLFICISIVLASLLLGQTFSTIQIIYLDNAFYQNSILAVFAADTAIVGVIMSINNNSLKAIFDKRKCGFNFNLIFEYAKRKSGLIIEDDEIIKKNKCYKIELVHEIYTIFMNSKMETSVGVSLLLLNASLIVIQNLNITVLMMIFTILYCLWVYNLLKFVSLDEEKHKEYIVNFISFVCLTSYDIDLLNWMKDDFMSFTEDTNLKTNEKKRLIFILDEAIKEVKVFRRNNEQIDHNISGQKLKLLEELKSYTTKKEVVKIILPN